MRAISARVKNLSVFLKLNDGSVVERDFSLCRGPALDRIHRGNRLDPRVRIRDGRLSWPHEIDFELDLILWGWPHTKRGRPLKRAVVGCGGSLIPAPIVKAGTSFRKS